MSKGTEKKAPQAEARADLNREFWAILSPGLFLTLVGFLIALSFVGAPPPKKLRWASGSTWGAYNQFAHQYRQNLASQGLEVEVVETNGSAENLQLLVEKKVDIAFVQGGLKPKDSSAGLVSLGSVYFEPLWVFVRGDQELTRLAQLKGKKISIGPEGSGTRAVALELFHDSGITDSVTLSEVGGEEAERQLYSGQLDAVLLTGSPTIPAVRRMLSAKGITLMQFERSQAIERRHQFLSRVPLYAGVVDLKDDIPKHDVELLAPAATLVVRADFHKALPPVILAAAKEIHGSGTILSDHDEFPSPLYCSFPIAQEARYFYERGLSFLYRHLPFYLASGLDRMAILLLPFVGLLFPIIRMLPPVYNWTMKRKIYKNYRGLQRLENKIGLFTHEELMEELALIEENARKLASMPPAYGADIYALRSHLERVRDRILAHQGGTPVLTLQTADKSSHIKRTSSKAPPSEPSNEPAKDQETQAPASPKP